MTHLAAKGLRVLLVVGVCSGTGCDRTRSLNSSFGKGKSGGNSAAVPGPLVTELTSADAEGFSRKSGRVAILYYHANWNGQCRQLDPYFDRITAQYAGVVVVGKIDTERFPEFATKMEVKDVPDVRMFRDGREVDRFVGLPEEEVFEKMIAKHAQGLKPPTGPEPMKAAPKPTTAPMPGDWLPPGMKRR
jgi:thioredoxin-like negative regulator of GroEL